VWCYLHPGLILEEVRKSVGILFALLFGLQRGLQGAQHCWPSILLSVDLLLDNDRGGRKYTTAVAK
jgi:hypothetical protein